MIPEISVIMPVYNTKEEYLRQAIDSILLQSFVNFEFVIIDDCSNEETKRILATYTDSRIRIYHNENNIGVAGSLNQALQMSQGKYIARMDSDDIALPDRLKQQWEYMENNPKVIVLGGIAQVMGKPEFLGIFKNKKREEIRLELLFNNISLVHPTVMFRGDLIRANALFYDENIVAEDYEMWTRCVRYGDIAVLPRVVLQYRIHANQVTTVKKDRIIQSTNEIRLKQFLQAKQTFTAMELKMFCELREYRCSENQKMLEAFLIKMETIITDMGYKNAGPLLWHYWVCIMRAQGVIGLCKYSTFYRIFRPSYLAYVCKYKIHEKRWRESLMKKLVKEMEK